MIELNLSHRRRLIFDLTTDNTIAYFLYALDLAEWGNVYTFASLKRDSKKV